jgi:hypothetical protein
VLLCGKGFAMSYGLRNSLNFENLRRRSRSKLSSTPDAQRKEYEETPENVVRRSFHFAVLAQSVEREAVNLEVAGSIPVYSVISRILYKVFWKIRKFAEAKP